MSTIEQVLRQHKDTMKKQNAHDRLRSAQAIACLGMFGLITFHIFSAFLFVLDLTLIKLNVVSLGYTCIIWSLLFSILLTMTVGATFVYGWTLRKHFKDTSECGEFFYPRTQLDIWGSLTNMTLLFVIGFVLVVVVGVQLGLSFEPSNQIMFDSLTSQYNFLHFMLTSISVLGAIEQLGGALTFVGRLYPVAPVCSIIEIVAQNQCSSLI